MLNIKFDDRFFVPCVTGAKTATFRRCCRGELGQQFTFIFMKAGGLPRKEAGIGTLTAIYRMRIDASAFTLWLPQGWKRFEHDDDLMMMARMLGFSRWRELHDYYLRHYGSLPIDGYYHAWDACELRPAEHAA